MDHSTLSRLLAAPLLAAGLALAANVASAQSRFRFDDTPGNLSKSVVPARYNLSFDVDPARDTFDGRAEIAVRVRSPVQAIELHALDLTAKQARLVIGGVAQPLDVTAKPDAEMWRLTRADGRPIPAGDMRLVIEYAGLVHTAGEGLYAAPYRVGGEPRRVLATQLQATHARRLFPAFDEPAFRAVFEIVVRAPQALEVVSNMPRTSRRVDGDRAVHRFAPTPPMPSYLVSLAVGRFDILAGKAAGLPVRFLAAEGKRDQARYALHVTQQLLPYYNAYFGIPYALPKFDQLAVPSTRFGAMEDWGLISYAESLLLVKPDRIALEDGRKVYSLMAHEISHQWFGDLVTAASWDEIWLNEAFADWMAYKATARFNPSWNVLLDARRRAEGTMDLDAGPATRAIRAGPVRETAVTDVFDAITYVKGGAVLTMLEQWVGPETFRRGVAAYMRGQRLSNATAADLWHYIGRAAGKDLQPVAASWTDQEGLPLVSASTSCENGRTQLELAQRRFLLLGQASDDRRWKIPVRYRRGAVTGTVLLDAERTRVTLGACSDAPVVVNADGLGFYRVDYDAPMRANLARAFAALPPADRIVLLGDSFALMQAGRVGVADYFALLRALPAVTDSSRRVLWSAARNHLEYLDRALAGSSEQARFRASARAQLAPEFARVAQALPSDQSPDMAELHSTLFDLLARFDDAPTIEAAQRAFLDDESGVRKLPPALRWPVMKAIGRRADRSLHERLRARLEAATDEDDRWLFAVALGATRDPALVDETLALALAGTLPANIASYLPTLVADESPFGERAYQFVLRNWAELTQLSGTEWRSHVLPGAAAGFNSESDATRVLEDQRRLLPVDGDAAAARRAAAIRQLAAVRARVVESIDKLGDAAAVR